MRLSGISRIIEAEVGVICRSRRLAEAGNANRGLNNSRYPAKTEFNNYFIINMNYYYQNNDFITTNKSNKVSQDKTFSKQENL